MLRGHVTKTSIGAQQEVKQDDSSSSPSNDSGSCGQRPVSPSDVCPICQDKMMESMQRLTYCKYAVSARDCVIITMLQAQLWQDSTP